MVVTKNKEKLVLSKTHYNNFYVAVEGSVGDWACYIGKKSDSFDKVKDYGDIISEEEARDLFPEFELLRWETVKLPDTDKEKLKAYMREYARKNREILSREILSREILRKEDKKCVSITSQEIIKGLKKKVAELQSELEVMRTTYQALFDFHQEDVTAELAKKTEALQKCQRAYSHADSQNLVLNLKLKEIPLLEKKVAELQSDLEEAKKGKAKQLRRKFDWMDRAKKAEEEKCACARKKEII